MFRSMQPKQRLIILSILITETAERVAYFGFRAVLVLYFSEALRFDDNESVALFAVTTAVAYFSPIIGALVADGALGRYHTIWYFGWMYALGLCLLTTAAYSAEQDIETGDGAPTAKSLGTERTLSFLGILLVCTGTGGIKPCVSAFGADQITLQDGGDSNTNHPAFNDEIDNGYSANRIRDDSAHDDDDDDDDDDTSPVDPPAPHGVPVVDHEKELAEHLRVYFASFYFCINVGALASFGIIPIVKKHFGYGTAFLIPAMFMIFALFVFASQRRHYKHSDRQSSEDQPDGRTTTTLWDVFRMGGHILRQRFCSSSYSQIRHNRIAVEAAEAGATVQTDNDIVAAVKAEDSIQSPATLHHRRVCGRPIENIDTNRPASSDDVEYGSKVYEDAAQALHLMPILLLFPMFWMLYDQQSSVWILQAKRMALHGMEPEELNVINPAEIMIFIPLFDQLVYPWMERHGINIEPLARIRYGMFLGAMSFAASSLLEWHMQSQPPATVHVVWQVPQLTILAVAEILVNVTGLEFAYAQAPDNMQALILGLYLMMTSIGDGLGAILYSSVFAHMNLAVVLAVCATLMLLNTLAFAKVSTAWTPYQRSGGPAVELNEIPSGVHA